MRLDHPFGLRLSLRQRFGEKRRSATSRTPSLARAGLLSHEQRPRIVRTLPLPLDDGRATGGGNHPIRQRGRWHPQVVLGAGHHPPLGVVWVATHQQPRARRPDDANGTAAPVDRMPPTTLIQMANEEEGGPGTLRQPGQWRQHRAYILIAEGIGLAIKIGHEGVEDDQFGLHPRDGPFDQRQIAKGRLMLAGNAIQRGDRYGRHHQQSVRVATRRSSRGRSVSAGSSSAVK